MAELEPFCSVIVPVYNSGDYLEKCVRSILAQTCDDFELILVDDGSTDQSPELCDRFSRQDARVHVIHQANGGHTRARNAGLAAARGEYAVFVDSDDFLEASLLADCRQAVQQCHPDIVLYGHRMVWQDHSVEKLQPYAPGYYDRAALESAIFPTLLTNGRFSLWERMVRRELLKPHQFQVDERLLLGEDLCCCVATTCDAQSLCVLEGIYYNYCQRPGSVVHSSQNYTFADWTRLRACLDSQVAAVLPNYPQQRGACSIRFLDRAVLGQLSREGLHLKTLRKTRRQLRDYSEELHQAKIPTQKRNLQVKHFCLKHRMVLTLFLLDHAVSSLRALQRHTSAPASPPPLS